MAERIKYLDPKADLTFKKVFGNHPDLHISLLNALLPLADEQGIEDAELIDLEQIPIAPLRMNILLAVRCEDVKKHPFIVEIYMIWSKASVKRMLFRTQL